MIVGYYALLCHLKKYLLKEVLHVKNKMCVEVLLHIYLNILVL